MGLFLNIKTRRHKDSRNMQGSLNGVAPLCRFKGGGVRVYSGGSSSDKPVADGPVLFSAFNEHETLDWFDGPRLVLVAFTVSRISSLSDSDFNFLRELGFNLPEAKPTNFAKALPDLSGTTSAVHALTSGIIIDVFAGDAGFSKAAQSVGYQSLAFDINPKRAQFPIQPLNPTKDEELQILLNLISEHAGSLQLVQCSVPLLGAFFSSDRGSPEFADLLVRRITAILHHCISFEVPVGVLHPATSRFWDHASLVQLWRSAPGHWATFDQCMHGGSQDRRAHWWASTPCLVALAALCSKDHRHHAQPPTASPWPGLLWMRAVEFWVEVLVSLRTTPPSMALPAPLCALPLANNPGKPDRWLASFAVTMLGPCLYMQPLMASSAATQRVPELLGANFLFGVALGFALCLPQITVSFLQDCRALGRGLRPLLLQHPILLQPQRQMCAELVCLAAQVTTTRWK